MIAHLGKIALMVVMTHGFRALGRLSSPRWAGLALGLPCTTAVALIGGGSDRGIDYAVAMSSNSLIGLAGAVALPMAYARAVLRGWKLPWAILVGVLTYLMVALFAGRILPRSGVANLCLASISVVAAIGLASRISVDQAPRTRHQALPKLPIRLLRTLVPIVCLCSSLLLGELLGAQVAGLMSTFPGMTLTILFLTHVESGAESALKMARALPAGNLGMVAFLAAFRFGCPSLGLVWGSIFSYAAALAMLTVVVIYGQYQFRARQEIDRFVRRWNSLCAAESGLSRLQTIDATGPTNLDRWRHQRTHGFPPRRYGRQSICPQASWPRQGRRFSPDLESLGT